MKKHLWSVSETMVPYKHVFDFNQALMDFGATVCAARQPKCDSCPMTRQCKSFKRMKAASVGSRATARDKPLGSRTLARGRRKP
jgi:A/G-specific adenine glycosylase